MTLATISPSRYLDVLRGDIARIAAVAPAALPAPVAGCPGWTVRDVVVHTGMVFLHKAANMRAGARAEYPPAPEPEADPMPWFTHAADALVAELESRGPTAPTYTWWRPDQSVGFWYRRMAQEAAVHRVDVEAATGDPAPVPDDIAVDGVDEVLQIFLPHFGTPDDPAWSASEAGAGAGRPVSVRTGGSGWTVVMQPDGVDVTPNAASAGPVDAVVTGEPSEVLLWLWGRRPASAVHVEGDDDLLRAFRARLVVATQ